MLEIHFELCSAKDLFVKKFNVTFSHVEMKKMYKRNEMNRVDISRFSFLFNLILLEIHFFAALLHMIHSFCFNQFNGRLHWVR